MARLGFVPRSLGKLQGFTSQTVKITSLSK